MASGVSESGARRRTGAVISYAYSLLQILVNLLYVPVLLSGIGGEEYGLYQLVGSVIAYLSIANSTFSAGATRFYCAYFAAGDEEGMARTLGILRRIYRVAYLAIVAATCVIAVAFSLVYRKAFSAWEVEESCLMLAVLALNLMLTMSNTMSIACITAHEGFIFLKLSQLVVLIAQPLLVVACIRVWPNALTVAVVQLLCNFACRVIQQAFARRRLGMRIDPHATDPALQRKILVFSGSILLGVLADQIFWKTDQLVLGYLFGTASVAVYSVGAQIVNAYTPLGFAVSSVFMPHVSKVWHESGDMAELSRLFVRVSRIALYPLLAVLLGFYVFGRDFIRLWAGPGYGEAYLVALMELTPFTIDISQNIGLVILQVIDRYGFRARMYLAAAVTNIVLTVVLAQQMGIVGAALATAIAILVSSGLVLNLYYQRVIGLDMLAWWRSALSEAAPMVALAIAAGVLWAPFSGRGWGVLALGIAAWALAFTLVSYFLCANERERELFRGIVRRVIPGAR